MPRKHRFESPALQFLFDRYVGDDGFRSTNEEDPLRRAGPHRLRIVDSRH